jgi:hypothetical protein
MLLVTKCWAGKLEVLLSGAKEATRKLGTVKIGLNHEKVTFEIIMYN